MGPGGKGTNQAVAAARLGADVRLLARVGDDLLAGMAYELYAAEEIESGHILRTPGERTAVGLVYLQHSGEHTIGVHFGAGWHLSPQDVRSAEQHLAPASVLVAQLEIPDETVAAASDLARRHGQLMLLNPAPARPVPPHILGAVDVLTPNESEARLLLGLRPDDESVGLEEIGRQLLVSGPQGVIITLGSRGCLVIQRDVPTAALPVHAVQTVDTVGAGDAFSGALAVALAEGRTLIDAARWASIAAALSTRTIGAIPGLPTRAAVDTMARS
jgi:ribokinase